MLSGPSAQSTNWRCCVPSVLTQVKHRRKGLHSVLSTSALQKFLRPRTFHCSATESREGDPELSACYGTAQITAYLKGAVYAIADACGREDVSRHETRTAASSCVRVCYRAGDVIAVMTFNAASNDFCPTLRVRYLLSTISLVDHCRYRQWNRRA